MTEQKALKNKGETRRGLSRLVAVVATIGVLAAAGCAMPNTTTLNDSDGNPAVVADGSAASLKSGTLEPSVWRFAGNTADTQALSSDAEGMDVAGGGVVRGLVIESPELGRLSVGGMSSLGVRGMAFSRSAETGDLSLTIDAIDDDTVGVLEAMATLEREVGARFAAFTEAQRRVFIENFNRAMQSGDNLINAIERAYTAVASVGTSEIGRAIGSAANQRPGGGDAAETGGDEPGG